MLSSATAVPAATHPGLVARCNTWSSTRKVFLPQRQDTVTLPRRQSPSQLGPPRHCPRTPLLHRSSFCRPRCVFCSEARMCPHFSQYPQYPWNWPFLSGCLFSLPFSPFSLFPFDLAILALAFPFHLALAVEAFARRNSRHGSGPPPLAQGPEIEFAAKRIQKVPSYRRNVSAYSQPATHSTARCAHIGRGLFQDVLVTFRRVFQHRSRSDAIRDVHSTRCPDGLLTPVQ